MIESELKFKRLHAAARLPVRGSALAAGLDIFAIEDVTLAPGARHGVRTGLAVAIPAGCYGRVAPRSGLAMREGLDVLAGVIDADYRGEIICALINCGASEVTIAAGQRVAQLIVERIITPRPVWSDDLDDTSRGAGGFGSTGVA